MKITAYTAIAMLALFTQASVLNKRMQKASKFTLTAAKRAKYEDFLKAYSANGDPDEAEPETWMKFSQEQGLSFRLVDQSDDFRIPADLVHKVNVINPNSKSQIQTATKTCFDTDFLGIHNATQYKSVNVVVVKEFSGLKQIWCCYNTRVKSSYNMIIDLHDESDGVITSLLYASDDGYDKWLSDQYKRVKDVYRRVKYAGLPACSVQ